MSHVKKRSRSETLSSAGILEGYFLSKREGFEKKIFSNSTGKKKAHLCQGFQIDGKKILFETSYVQLDLCKYFQIWKLYIILFKACEDQMWKWQESVNCGVHFQKEHKQDLQLRYWKTNLYDTNTHTHT